MHKYPSPLQCISKHTQLTLFLFVFLLQLSLRSLADSSYDTDCMGPRTPDEIGKILWGNTSNYTEWNRTRPNLSKLLAENPKARPSRAEPDTVRISLKLLFIRDVDMMLNEGNFVLRIDQHWNDYRLSFKRINGCFNDDHYAEFDMDDISNIWKPDVLIENLLAEPEHLSSTFSIYPNGDVEISRISSLKISCQLNFAEYLIHPQICQIIFCSRDDATKISLQFHKDNTTIENDEYDLWTMMGVESLDPDPKNPTETNNDLVVKLQNQPNPKHYVFFFICPVTLLVICSWGSFFITRTSAPGRVIISIFGFLANMNYMNTILPSIPKDSAESYMFKFILACLGFQFYSVVEFVFCNYLTRIEIRTDKVRELAKEKIRKKIRIQESQSFRNPKESDVDNHLIELDRIIVTKNDMIAIGGIHKIDYLLLREDGTMKFKDQHVDIFSRYLFPVLYCIACARFKIFQLIFN